MLELAIPPRLTRREAPPPPPHNHIFPQAPTFLLGGLPGRERLRRAPAPAGSGDCTRRATPRRTRPPGTGCSPGAAPWPRPWLQYAFSCAAKRRDGLGRSRKRRSRFSCAELGSVAVRTLLAQRGAEIGSAAAAVCAFLAQRSTELSSVAVAYFFCAAQRRDRRSLSRSRSLRFS
jgi:hypothetical protein